MDERDGALSHLLLLCDDADEGDGAVHGGSGGGSSADVTLAAWPASAARWSGFLHASSGVMRALTGQSARVLHLLDIAGSGAAAGGAATPSLLYTYQSPRDVG